MICTSCKVETVRIESDRRTGRGRRRYLNERGQLWYGQCCYSCHLKSNIKPSGNRTVSSKRKCRDCKTTLPTTRYFRCDKCIGNAPDRYLDWNEVCGSVSVYGDV